MTAIFVKAFVIVEDIFIDCLTSLGTYCGSCSSAKQGT
ncbi:hypothetical protein FX984_03008 [Pseudomonas marginalis]|nr:hypothetical protein FX984_03008 [Pseudomonas marginalis]